MVERSVRCVLVERMSMAKQYCRHWSTGIYNYTFKKNNLAIKCSFAIVLDVAYKKYPQPDFLLIVNVHQSQGCQPILCHATPHEIVQPLQSTGVSLAFARSNGYGTGDL